MPLFSSPSLSLHLTPLSHTLSPPSSRYYAAVTYSDHMLGKVLAELESLGVADNTIVVFHSDHGYQLGEANEW